MKTKITLLAIFFLLLFGNTTFAKHIIGGVMTYEYLDNGEYEITMRIFRDCKGGGAPFDGDVNDKNGNDQGFASINVFRQNQNGSYSSVSQLELLLTSKRFIDPPAYPCMETPPNPCVEEGIYKFKYKIPDFPSNFTYHFVYQRCCRNNDIVNIPKPEDAGATYTIAITPAAMQAKNSSPVLKNFPPTVLCSNVPFEFDHSATDKDGNKIVYSFCNSLDGGGPTLSGSACNSARPTPACPPPFKNINYLPTYSTNQPLGANANLVLDSQTGLLKGEPKINGQFVVGICIEEFDANGVLLSKIFRDFQFNVASCNALVLAGVAATDTSLIQKKYTIRLCGAEEITFQNGSTQEKFINGYLWNIDLNGQPFTSTEKNPTVKFPGLGIYTGYMVANPGKKPCSDTAKIRVEVFPYIKADFKYAYDTCIAGPVVFTDLSETGSGQMVKWDWDFSDKNTSKTQSPTHEYKIPGDFKVKLQVEDKNKCKATVTKGLRYFPVPPLLIVKPDTFVGCTPLTMKINNLSYPIDNSYKIEWDLGDGTTSNQISPTHTYKNAGVFSAFLKVTSPIGCKTERNFPNLVEVRQSPAADFGYVPGKVSSINSTVTFTDKSVGANKWIWSFGKDEGTSASRNPVYTFRDTGFKEVKLVVTHPSGCRDTALQIIDVEPIIKYFLPNAFTPNYDSNNEEFKAKGIFDGITNFKLIIFNRWGDKVFEATEPTAGWNGRRNNDGDQLPEGVYVYNVSYIGPRNKPLSQKGTITLLR
jgi:gliding motility-associated-like protein